MSAEFLADHPNREMRLLGSIATGLKNNPKAEGVPFKNLTVREENVRMPSGEIGLAFYMDVCTSDRSCRRGGRQTTRVVWGEGPESPRASPVSCPSCDGAWESNPPKSA